MRLLNDNIAGSYRTGAAPASAPTHYRQRLIDSLSLLCVSRPPEDLVDQWINDESADLQDWAMRNSKLNWSTGHATIEAAELMAVHPRDGFGHTM